MMLLFVIVLVPFSVGRDQKHNGILLLSSGGQIKCRVVSMETNISPKKGLGFGPGGQRLIDWSPQDER